MADSFGANSYNAEPNLKKNNSLNAENISKSNDQIVLQKSNSKELFELKKIVLNGKLDEQILKDYLAQNTNIYGIIANMINEMIENGNKEAEAQYKEDNTDRDYTESKEGKAQIAFDKIVGNFAKISDDQFNDIAKYLELDKLKSLILKIDNLWENPALNKNKELNKIGVMRILRLFDDKNIYSKIAHVYIFGYIDYPIREALLENLKIKNGLSNVIKEDIGPKITSQWLGEGVLKAVNKDLHYNKMTLYYLMKFGAASKIVNGIAKNCINIAEELNKLEEINPKPLFAEFYPNYKNDISSEVASVLESKIKKMLEEGKLEVLYNLQQLNIPLAKAIENITNLENTEKISESIFNKLEAVYKAGSMNEINDLYISNDNKHKMSELILDIMKNKQIKDNVYSKLASFIEQIVVQKKFQVLHNFLEISGYRQYKDIIDRMNEENKIKLKDIILKNCDLISLNDSHVNLNNFRLKDLEENNKYLLENWNEYIDIEYVNSDGIKKLCLKYIRDTLAKYINDKYKEANNFIKIGNESYKPNYNFIESSPYGMTFSLSSIDNVNEAEWIKINNDFRDFFNKNGKSEEWRDISGEKNKDCGLFNVGGNKDYKIYNNEKVRNDFRKYVKILNIIKEEIDTLPAAFVNFKACPDGALNSMIDYAKPQLYKKEIGDILAKNGIKIEAGKLLDSIALSKKDIKKAAELLSIELEKLKNASVMRDIGIHGELAETSLFRKINSFPYLGMKAPENMIFPGIGLDKQSSLKNCLKRAYIDWTVTNMIEAVKDALAINMKFVNGILKESDNNKTFRFITDLCKELGMNVGDETQKPIIIKNMKNEDLSNNWYNDGVFPEENYNIIPSDSLSIKLLEELKYIVKKDNLNQNSGQDNPAFNSEVFWHDNNVSSAMNNAHNSSNVYDNLNHSDIDFDSNLSGYDHLNINNNLAQHSDPLAQPVDNPSSPHADNAEDDDSLSDLPQLTLQRNARP